MNSTVRLIIALVGAAALAALATPELSGKFPPGTSQILSVAIAAVLHKMNAAAPAAPSSEGDA